MVPTAAYALSPNEPMILCPSAGGDLARQAVVRPQPLARAPLLYLARAAERLVHERHPVLGPERLRQEVAAAHQDDEVAAGPLQMLRDQRIGARLVDHLRRRHLGHPRATEPVQRLG